MEDINELKELLAAAKREPVRLILQNAITKLEKELASVPPTPAAVVAAAPTHSSTASSTAPKTEVYRAIESWGWEQNKEFVEVMVLKGLDGVGALPKENITCNFETAAFDLKIKGLNGVNYRLRVTNLDKDIVPEKSRIEVKKNRLSIFLKKKGEWDHWMDLVAKKLRKPEEDKKKAEDPSASIMEMMKDMYDNGDENTKKIIAEAWTKSREQQVKGGLGKGGAGDDFDI